MLPELELCFRLLLLRALGGLLVLCTALPLCAHALGGVLPLRCAAKLTFRVDRSPEVPIRAAALDLRFFGRTRPRR